MQVERQEILNTVHQLVIAFGSGDPYPIIRAVIQKLQAMLDRDKPPVEKGGPCR